MSGHILAHNLNRHELYSDPDHSVDSVQFGLEEEECTRVFQRRRGVSIETV